MSDDMSPPSRNSRSRNQKPQSYVSPWNRTTTPPDVNSPTDPPSDDFTPTSTFSDDNLSVTSPFHSNTPARYGSKSAGADGGRPGGNAPIRYGSNYGLDSTFGSCNSTKSSHESKSRSYPRSGDSLSLSQNPKPQAYVSPWNRTPSPSDNATTTNFVL